jgi:tRNA modification GTPase
VRRKKRLVVINKMDVAVDSKVAQISQQFKTDKIVKISITQKHNLSTIEEFLREVVNQFKWQGETPLVNQRQRNDLHDLYEHLQKIFRQVEEGVRHSELVAEEIRQALQVIGRLIGEVTTEEILEEIFARFCVGK